MKKIEWIDGGKYKLENGKRFIEIMQLKHPFCTEVNNKEYMEDVRLTYTELYGVDEKSIDITSEDTFIDSFCKLNLAKIY